ncbi:Sensor histidine kinase DesK [Mycolicibacterium vanbaalenii]|uniref:histidine kinase n=1 Tax=Mycolicibacterium vanbaalenii TaxID=110539 RepID=A0A5S9RCN3_MYCVN|nr:histidine kinase [Mycolicibacterium vanbaalenii]CAA0137480.1 Sensor histidine kinase DesK [Mycolicibacterium vanbaalenii]
MTHTDHRTSRADLAAIIAALAVSIGALVIDPDVVAGRQLPGIAIAAVAAVLLVVAGRFGRATVVAIGVLDVVTLAWTSSPIALRALLIVALYRLVRRSDDRSVLWFGSLVAIVVAGFGAQFGGEAFWFEWAADAAVLLLPVAAADARRSNLQRRADAVERQVSERLQAERLRIAYDLHDIVAHSLSAITVQSGIAAHVFERDPAAARSALVEINNAGRRSLDELRSLLGLLRSDESVPLRPAPTATTTISDVVDAAAGLSRRVEVVEDGHYPANVAESTVVTVHRIVHECLVNVARHAGDVPTIVRLRHADNGVHVTVSNDAPATARVAAPGTGIGLVAIRERAELLGGTVHAGPTDDGGFTVRAFVPYQLPGRGA